MRDCAIAVCSDAKLFPAAYALCLSAQWPNVYLLTERGTHTERAEHAPFKILTPNFIDKLPDFKQFFPQLSPFTFLRLLLPSILTRYRRILYLDCDIRIAGDFESLFHIDMGTAPIAAALDPRSYSNGMRYFNAGVMLIDCKTWQQRLLTERTLETVRVMSCHDQDALNLACSDFLMLSPRWNFPCSAIGADIESALEPVFIHNYDKPWNVAQANRRERALFLASILRTPFPEFGRPTMKERQRFIERILKSPRRWAHQRDLANSLKRHLSVFEHDNVNGQVSARGRSGFGRDHKI